MNTTTLAVFFIILGGILFTYFASLAGYSAAVIYNMQVPGGIKIATVLAEIFRSAYGQFGFVLFIVILIFALFDSQFSVYDGIARMFADTVTVETHATDRRPYRFWYFLMMAVLCVVGMITVWMRTPYILWVIINWAGVAVHAGLTVGVTYLNAKLLPGPIKPKMCDRRAATWPGRSSCSSTSPPGRSTTTPWASSSRRVRLRHANAPVARWRPGRCFSRRNCSSGRAGQVSSLSVHGVGRRNPGSRSGSPRSAESAPAPQAGAARWSAVS